MKKVTLILLTGLILSACNKDNVKVENVELLGKWKLIEQLSDPGDGSGVFKSVESEKTIEFLDNGTVISNGTLCSMNTEKGVVSTGTYTIDDGFIIPEGCDYSELKVFFELKNSNLILGYQCFEGCGQKFVKLNNKD